MWKCTNILGFITLPLFMYTLRFGYPDKTYLQRVREELAIKGVTEQDVEKELMKKLEIEGFRQSFTSDNKWPTNAPLALYWRIARKDEGLQIKNLRTKLFIYTIYLD